MIRDLCLSFVVGIEYTFFVWKKHVRFYSENHTLFNRFTF